MHTCMSDRLAEPVKKSACRGAARGAKRRERTRAPEWAYIYRYPCSYHLSITIFKYRYPPGSGPCMQSQLW